MRYSHVHQRAASVFVTVTMLVMAFCVPMESAADVLNIGTDKQLFLGPWDEDGRDKHLIEQMAGVTITTHEARVTGEQLKMPEPGARGKIFRDGEIFRMYYFVGAARVGRASDETILYAESSDGLRWERRNLGLLERDGSRANNIIFPNDDYLDVHPSPTYPNAFLSIFIDPNARSPEEKYKATIKLNPGPDGKGKYGFASPDGVWWKLITGNLDRGDGTFWAFWDERLGQYVGYSRHKSIDSRKREYYRQTQGDGDYLVPRRLRMMRSVSDDFIQWSEPTIVLAPDEKDLARSGDFHRVQFHHTPVWQPEPEAYIAFNHIDAFWKVETHPHHGRMMNQPGTIDIQLATSRDGIDWNRTPGRRPFIRLGPEGTFWSGMIFLVSQPVHAPDGRNLHIYFEGWDKGLGDPTRVPPPTYGRAEIRIDGFVSADAAYTGGELITKPLVFSGDKLALNLATGAGGVVQVELLDERGRPIKGFSINDADEIYGNHIRTSASWNGSTDVSTLAGRPVQIRFVMRDSQLFSFQFLADDTP